MKEALALTLALLACTERPAQRPSADRTVPAAPTDSVPVSSGANQLVRPGVLPATVRATCDSALTLVHEALTVDVRREDGDFSDSFKGARRLGCRLTAEGSFATLKDSAGPVGAVEKVFTRRGWKGDLRYMADGPDGSDIGLRRLDQLCLVLGQWDGGDDSGRHLLHRLKRITVIEPSWSAPATSRRTTMPEYPTQSGASRQQRDSTASTPSRSGSSTRHIWTATSTPMG